jgi:hypothetical protein
MLKPLYRVSEDSDNVNSSMSFCILEAAHSCNESGFHFLPLYGKTPLVKGGYMDAATARKSIISCVHKIATGSIPRTVVTKLGRKLFLDLTESENWWTERNIGKEERHVGRTRK